MAAFASYTHPGRHSRNFDFLQQGTKNGTLYALLCDGMNHTPGSDTVAQACINAAFPALLAGAAPEAALQAGQDAVLRYKAQTPAAKCGCTTAAALVCSNSHCRFATVGDTRVYVFLQDALSYVSEDDSKAYEAYRARRICYEDIRLSPERTQLTACIGDTKPIVPHTGEAALQPGDAVLLCTDGFWQYLYETELQLDLIKFRHASDWLDTLLLRFTARSMLDGDNFTALTFMAQAENE
ncbi:MAG: protein phosphatase 2C domain-containing protein [Eubacteriales bacterium]|nr:protein phosphatase 2C domain-containing protein [Eubacteriales bacterium]